MDEFEKEYKKARRVFWIIFLIYMVVGTALIGGLGFVAVHFLKKIW